MIDLSQLATVSAFDRLLGSDHALSLAEVAALRAMWGVALAARGLTDDGDDPNNLIRRFVFALRPGLDGSDHAAAFLQIVDTHTDAIWCDAWFCRALSIHPALANRPLDQGFLSVVTLCREHYNLFLCVNLAQFLAASGLNDHALTWMERAVRVMHNTIAVDPTTAGALPIYYQWMAQMAFAAGRVDQAIRYEILRHAADPTACDFVDLSRYVSAHPDATKLETIDILRYGRLSPAIAQFVGVFLSERDAGPIDQLAIRHLFHEAASEVPAARTFGAGMGVGPLPIERNTGTIARLRHVDFHVDYWKVLVTGRDGRMLPQFCSGAAEVPMLAERLGFRPRAPSMQGATALIANIWGWSSYHHWLIEILPRLGMVLESREAFDRIIAFHSDRPFCRQAFEALGIPPGMIVDAEFEVRGAAETLIVPSATRLPTRFGCAFARSIFLGHDDAGRSRGRRFFVSRRHAAKRDVVDEDALLDILRPRGFEVVHFETMTMQEQAQVMADAEIVMGPHGAGLTNMIFCPPTARIIELSPPGVPDCFHLLAHATGLDLTVIGTAWDAAATNMRVDLELCRDALDALGI